MKKVSIKIKDGEVSSDFSGFVGKACETLEERIRPGEMNVQSKELKPEYHYETAPQAKNKNTW